MGAIFTLGRLVHRLSINEGAQPLSLGGRLAYFCVDVRTPIYTFPNS